MGLNYDNLGGYGLGLNYSGVQNLVVKAQASRRLITGYNPNGNNTNSDGSLQTDTRLWVSANYFF
jgi:hypothetical protein